MISVLLTRFLPDFFLTVFVYSYLSEQLTNEVFGSCHRLPLWSAITKAITQKSLCKYASLAAWVLQRFQNAKQYRSILFKSECTQRAQIACRPQHSAFVTFAAAIIAQTNGKSSLVAMCSKFHWLFSWMCGLCAPRIASFNRWNSIDADRKIFHSAERQM